MNDEDEGLPGPALCGLIVAACILGVGLISVLAWWIAT